MLTSCPLHTSQRHSIMHTYSLIIGLFQIHKCRVHTFVLFLKFLAHSSKCKNVILTHPIRSLKPPCASTIKTNLVQTSEKFRSIFQIKVITVHIKLIFTLSIPPISFFYHNSVGPFMFIINVDNFRFLDIKGPFFLWYTHPNL